MFIRTYDTPGTPRVPPYSRAIVEDNNDPMQLQRIRARPVFISDDIPTEHLPWSQRLEANTLGDFAGAGSMAVPKLNSSVLLFYPDGDKYSSIYMGSLVTTKTADILHEDYPNTTGVADIDRNELKIAPDVIELNLNTNTIIKVAGLLEFQAPQIQFISTGAVQFDARTFNAYTEGTTTVGGVNLTGGEVTTQQGVSLGEHLHPYIDVNHHGDTIPRVSSKPTPGSPTFLRQPVIFGPDKKEALTITKPEIPTIG